jgi:hypothetical protein
MCDEPVKMVRDKTESPEVVSTRARARVRVGHTDAAGVAGLLESE